MKLIAEELGGKDMGKTGSTVTAALDRIAEAIRTQDGGNGNSTISGIEFPGLAIGPYEEVLIFEVAGHVVLHEVESPDADAYFHIKGKLHDLTGRDVKGGQFETVFPFKFDLAPQILSWPPEQGGPFDRPPVDGKLTDGYGFSKSNFVFADGSLVTVGPSIPKFTALEGGAGQLWVTSVGVTTDGTGRFSNLRGMGAFNGSGYYPKAPDFSTRAGRKQLRDGFPVKVSINIKLIGAKHLALT